MRVFATATVAAASIVMFFGLMRIIQIESGWEGYWLSSVLVITLTLLAAIDFAEERS